MSTAEKALAAIREYDRLMTAIAQNKADIGDGLDACVRYVDTDEDGRKCEHLIPGDGKSHLAEAFEPRLVSNDYFDQETYSSPEEIAEILIDCPGCQKAYAAIQERKANRKKLGAVKRAMRMIGRTKA